MSFPLISGKDIDDQGQTTVAHLKVCLSVVFNVVLLTCIYYFI